MTGNYTSDKKKQGNYVTFHNTKILHFKALIKLLFNYFTLYLNKKIHEMNNRRNFLKTACKPIVLAAFGIPLMEACSTDDTTEELNIGGSPSASTPSEPLEIDISSGNFTSLKDVGGWLNYTAQNILLVRISESEIRVFDNKCPHQGNRDNWSYDGDEFTCGYHNNSYSDSCSGSLTCYDTNLEGNILTVSF